jgi:hypothetical protein
MLFIRFDNEALTVMLVPELGSFALVALGIVGLCFRRK